MKKTFVVTIRFKTRKEAVQFRKWWRAGGGESVVLGFYRWKKIKFKL